MTEQSSSLTEFGRSLSNATRLRSSDFDSSTSSWPQAYNINASTIERLKNTLSIKPNVLLVGAGRHHNIDQVRTQTHGWIRSGVHWTNFNPLFPVDFLVSTHTAPLQASLHTKLTPALLIHGVYSKVPPCLKKSITIRWSDPYLLKGLKGEPTVELINSLIQKKSHGVAPYIPSVRNTLFLNAMVMLWLGAKQLAFTAVDPHNPEYFFSGNSELILDIVRSLSVCDPWLAEWDGRNERIKKYKRESSHRVQVFTHSILKEQSAVGGKDYLVEFDRGFNLLQKLAKSRGVKLGYFGDSSYLKTTGLRRLD